ncbi:hypothetical protein NDU88_006647 [Pleurodeles waltl]|uniref:Uncharacterized protein n=1 Tax=Pleurodeles waltl TaxID=8319 RepID=A0AAV7WF28_PLEWA|nr:hypothetical protein NDU88_006647 [Pleurodeles waltl]
MADDKVRAALALLQQAGRMDLVRTEALATGRPARRASAGVAAAVMACSPPLGERCRPGSGWAGDEGAAWVGRGRAGRWLWELRGLPRGWGTPGLRFGKGVRPTAEGEARLSQRSS